MNMIAKSRSDVVAWLTAYVHERHQAAWAGDRVALADFGIDSLSAVDLVCALERWLGIPVPTDLLSGVTDTHGLLQAIADLQRRAAERLPSERAWEKHVNPYLAAKLKQLKIDRTFVRGEGAYLFDQEGRRYLDFMAQYGALPFGHHPQEIWQAIQALHADAEPVFCQPSISHSSGELAKRLLELAPPGLRYVTFSNSGAEAVEVALKLARQATGRMRILSTHRGFHGKTFGALSATGNPDYQAPFGLPLDGFDKVGFGDIAALEAALACRPGSYAAFIVEAIQGEGGVRMAEPGYLRAAKEVCARHGTLLVVDEVQTGLGRTGALFACETEGVEPDILTLAKALGGGLVPIGATLCSEGAYGERFALKHSSTFAGNALAARAGLATLDLLTRNDGALLQNVRREGQYLLERFEAIRARHPWLVSEVRGRGFMLGISFTTERAPWPENFLGIAAQEGELAQFVASYLLNVENVRLAPTLNGGNVLRVQPPLNATHEQCVMVADALARTVDVLASRQTGIFYRAILRREAPPALPAPAAAPSSPVPTADDGRATRFAFLMHPLDEAGYAEYDTSLDSLERDELREFSESMTGLLDPVVGTTVDIESATGARARGDFIMISHTAAQLKQMPQSEALDVLNKGVALARRRGASIVGLGAYTSVVSGGGARLVNPTVKLTSGNSYTVVSAIEALDLVVQRHGHRWDERTAGVVGAAGAIGACMVMLLSERAPRLVLIGNPAHEPAIGRERLLAIARSMVRHALADPSRGVEPASLAAQIVEHSASGATPEEVLLALESSGRLILTASIQAAAMADVIVAATSFPGQLFNPDLMARNAVICDVSRPRSIGESILQRRPDVLVIDGGIVALPGRPRIGPYGLEDGTSYACMAETMLLALEGDPQDTSLGHALDAAEVQRQQRLARKHGFSLSSLRSFGRPVKLEA
ncbi:MAG: aminotransferase class-III [Ramlibacter sp.]|nr:aminotransferase class-III [Ramlibacter sp.]